MICVSLLLVMSLYCFGILVSAGACLFLLCDLCEALLVTDFCFVLAILISTLVPIIL